MDRFSELEAFIRTVELGSQVAAAAALDISPVSMSRHIRSLEQRLGVRLLQRTTRRQTLTEAGTAYFEQAKRAIDLLNEAGDNVTEYQTSLRGSLRLSVPMSFGVRHFSKILAEFSLKYPDIRIDLILNDRVVDLIEDGFDVALRLGQLRDSEMHSRRTNLYRVALCASPAYLAKHGTPNSPIDLLRHNCLSFVGTGRMQQWTLTDPNGTEETIDVTGNLTANNGTALMVAAIAGQGIVKQPFFIVDDALKDGSLVQVLPNYKLRELELHIVYPALKHLPLKTRTLIDFLVQVFSAEEMKDSSFKSGASIYSIRTAHL